jgi:hypothetical protein
VDVLRGTASFRIPAGALRGARHDQGIAGKVVPPHGVLVLTWQHGDLLLDSGFRATDGVHNAWVSTVSEMVKENTA